MHGPRSKPQMSEPTLTLNSAWLRNRVAELGLKQWWLAEQIGVDKKTVIRWLHGHVRSIQHSNATALAGVLGCRLSDLELPRGAAATRRCWPVHTPAGRTCCIGAARARRRRRRRTTARVSNSRASSNRRHSAACIATSAPACTKRGRWRPVSASCTRP